MSGRDVAILRSLAERIDPTDAGAHNNLGVVFFQKGLVEDAVAAFERALELDPRLDVARRNAEVAFLQSGHFQRRVRELGERLREHPGDEEARDALARTCLLAGDPDGAAREWAWLLERRPESLAYHMKLAYAEAERGRTGRARAILERAVHRAPDDPAVHLQLAELLHGRGDLERAEAAARRALALDDGLARGHALLGRILESMGREDDARRSLERAHALDPGVLRQEDHLSLERYLSASVARAERRPRTEAVEANLGRFAQATELRRSGDLPGAARELERALDEGDDAFEVRQSLAELRLLQGDLEAAAEAYGALTGEREDSPKLWNERGVALHRLGRLDDAIDAYRHAVALDHTYGLGWNNLGVARAQHGDGGAAERALRKSAEHDPPPEVLWNLALFLGNADEAEEAVRVCRAAVDQDPTVAESWSRLGSALFQASRSAEARDALLRALELDSDLAEARYQLGFALSALGDFPGALRETKRALELDPVFPAPRYQLLIDVQFEAGSLPAPDTDEPRRVVAGTAIRSFEFEPESLERAFAGLGEPAGPAAERPAELDRWLERAREAMRRGQLRRASEDAAAALSLAPTSPDTLLLQGEIFLRRGLAGEALERFDAVLGAGTIVGVADAAQGRARALLDLGRPVQAAAAAEVAIERGAEGALTLLGRALLGLGEAERAVATFRRAIADEPTPPALLGLGHALLALDRAVDAEQAFRAALELAPGAVAARVGLARALTAAGDLRTAETEYAAAVRTLPSFDEAALGLADLQRRRGASDEAIRTLVDFLALDPTHVDGLVQLGRGLFDVGRPDQATSAIRRALRLEPGHQGALEARARLDAAEGD